MIVGYGTATWRYHTAATCPYVRGLTLTVANEDLAVASNRERCLWCARHPDAPTIADMTWPRDEHGQAIPVPA